MIKEEVVNKCTKYSSVVGDFSVNVFDTEIHINRGSIVVLQNHKYCEEVRELRDLLNEVLDE